MILPILKNRYDLKRRLTKRRSLLFSEIKKVTEIINRVKRNGDTALKELTRKYSHCMNEPNFFETQKCLPPPADLNPVQSRAYIVLTHPVNLKYPPSRVALACLPALEGRLILRHGLKALLPHTSRMHPSRRLGSNVIGMQV